jgi:putative tryptophan/tyrosine transport system substrate-binding protein
MRRRAFIAALSGAAAWPLVARGQQADRAWRIGYLIGSTADDPQNLARVDAFVRALAQLGWTEGRNVKIEKR